MSDIKTAVKKHYAALATEPGCCSAESAGTSSCCSQVSSTPLGCGMPMRHASLRPGETVLDLGSGPGIEALAAARVVGRGGRVIGVDMTPEMIEAARARAGESATNVEFRLGDIEALPLESGSVDVVISNCVINLAPDKGKVFAEMHRVLKAGGRFSVSDMVTHGSMPESLRSNPELWSGCVSGAVGEEEYLGIIRKAGFVDVRVASSVEFGSPGPDCTLLSVTVTGTKPAAGRSVG